MNIDAKGIQESRKYKTKLSREIELISVIDSRNLERECFILAVENLNPDLKIFGYPSISEWADYALPDGMVQKLILINIGNQDVSNAVVRAEIRQLVDLAEQIPVIVLAQSADPREMIAAIDSGARGYVPASIGIDAIIDATRLTAEGGVFVPTASILSLRDALAPKVVVPSNFSDELTHRQFEVASALWRGKANKVIAYELEMSESTVKVHIRNIMRKLNATNRTEAAFKLNAFFAHRASSDD